VLADLERINLFCAQVGSAVLAAGPAERSLA
jgi:hypothetical protein